MDNQSIQHTRWNCTYHIVFIPKYRRKIMYGANKKDLVEIIRNRQIILRSDIKLLQPFASWSNSL